MKAVNQIQIQQLKQQQSFVGELNQVNESSDAKEHGMQHTKSRLGMFLKNKWKAVLHGQYISVDTQLVSEEDIFVWLLRGELKAETESEVIAQNQALQIKCHATEILKTITADTDCVNNMTRQ
jgi:hypothetical protein